MTSTQKIIKYIALALAFAIIVGIFSSIASVAALIGGIFSVGKNISEAVSDDFKALDISGDVSELHIDIISAELEIAVGDEFSIETDSGYITAQNSSGKIKIREKKKGLLGYSSLKTVILTIPEDFVFDEVDIEGGAGRLKIEALSAKELSLDLGAGEVDIQNLEISSEAEINGGAGKITLKDSSFNELSLDMGVGELDFTAEITQKGDIDFGVGNAKVKLIGSANDYSIRLDKGLGNASYCGESVSGSKTCGSGDAVIDMDGGIGNIDIDFDD